MDEQTRVAAMKAFQTLLALGGGMLIASGKADQVSVNTWTNDAVKAVSALAGPVWILANHYGFKLSDLFRKDTSRMDALEQHVSDVSKELSALRSAVEAWQRDVEARKTA